MSRLQQWVALTAVVVLGVLAAGWVLLISPRRAEAHDLVNQRQSTTAATSALHTQLATLQAQARDLPAQQAKLEAVSAKLPSDPAEPNLLRVLTDAASGSGVEFVSIAPGSLAPAVDAPTSAPAPADGAAAAPTATPTGSLHVLPVTINVFGDYFEIEQYLAALEDLPRALRVISITTAPGLLTVAPSGAAATPPTDGGSLISVITAQVYVAAPSSGSAAAPTPAK